MHLYVTLTFLLLLQFPVTLQVKCENLRLTLKVNLGQFVRKALSHQAIKYYRFIRYKTALAKLV